MAFEIEQYNAEFFKRPPKETIPEKEEWVDVYDEMRVHTRGDSPGELFTTRRPNEDPDIYDYRMKIYQPITKGPINRSINKLHRIFMNANFSLKISEELKDYLKEKRFQKRNFFEFFHGSVTKRMIEDPNGYLAWLPSGEGLLDITKKVNVVPDLIDSNKIWFVDDEVLTWSDTTTGMDAQDMPMEFFSLTKDAFYIHVRKDNDTYELGLIYKHDLDMIPAVVLGGVLREDMVFESYFNSFLPFGNEAIRQYSDWQAVNVTSAFPYRTEEFTECDYPQCGGKGWWEEDCDDCDHPKVINCRACGGTGWKSHNSPYGTFIRKEPGPGEELNTRAMIEFTSPARDILDYSQQAWQTLLEDAKKSIFDDLIDEAQSGVAKIIDREDLHSFLSQIADNVYDHLLSKSLIILNGYRDINAKDQPEITKPTSFVVKTEGDLVEEMGVLLEKKAPMPFILETVKDLAKKRFGNNETTKSIIDFLLVYDPLFALSPEEKNMLVATNVITDEQRDKNIGAFQAINEILFDDPELFEKPYKAVKELVDKKILELAPRIEPIRDDNGNIE